MGNNGLLSQLFNSNLARQAVGGAIGAGLAKQFAPKAPQYQAPTAQQLNAAVIPQMKNAAALRQAHLLGAQGAKGGRSSSDTLESAQLNQELARGIGSQQALNQIQAANYHNNVANLQQQAARQRYQDIIGGGIAGAGFAPHQQSQAELQAAAARQQNLDMQNQYMKMLMQQIQSNQYDPNTYHG